VSQHAIKPTWSWLSAAYRLSDAAAILCSLTFAVQYTSPVSGAQFLFAATLGIAIYLVTSEFTGMYRQWGGPVSERETLCAFLTWGLSLTVLMAFGFAARSEIDGSRWAVVLWFLSTPVVLVASRIVIRSVRRGLMKQGVGVRRMAIYGANELGFRLAHNVLSSPEAGLNLVGFYDDRHGERSTTPPVSLPWVIGGFDDILAAARSGEIDQVVICLPMRAEKRTQSLLSALADTTTAVYLAPDFFVFELLHSRWSNVGGLPVVSVFENPLYGVDGVIKRAVDFVLSLCGLILLLPLFVVVAAVIRLTSPGPVFFRQRRYGLDGREILVWKFRSMTVCEDGPKVQQAQKNDNRVTKIGAVIRKTSIDELPQLVNVLLGEMSLVGPRPHATAHNEQYRKLIHGYMLRHKIKPGITGLAQVEGWRGETDTLDKMENRVRCDHQYIRDWSLWLDVMILFRTVGVVLGRKNAY